MFLEYVSGPEREKWNNEIGTDARQSQEKRGRWGSWQHRAALTVILLCGKHGHIIVLPRLAVITRVTKTGLLARIKKPVCSQLKVCTKKKARSSSRYSRPQGAVLRP
jgi:hypothetical protein